MLLGQIPFKLHPTTVLQKSAQTQKKLIFFQDLLSQMQKPDGVY